MGPVNDLLPIRVGPLERDDACYLARCLLAGTPGVSVPQSQQKQVCERLADVTNGIPFYLHHLVRDIARRRTEATPDAIDGLVTAAIESPEDPWHLRHYSDRLDSYYGDEAPLIALILDQFAAAGALTVDAMVRHLRTIGHRRDREDLVDLVHLLERDYYVRRNPDGTDEFASELLRRYWRHLRRLGNTG
jgi:hypothetical protein